MGVSRERTRRRQGDKTYIIVYMKKSKEKVVPVAE